MRLSSLIVGFFFTLLLAVVVLLRNVLYEAHIDETILKVASDASVYFELFELLYADASLRETPALFLIGSPMLFMKLADGQLLAVQAFNLGVMFLALHAAMNSLQQTGARLRFAAGALIFPYFLFGGLSMNKEVYAMSSAIFFGAWLIRGCWRHLLLAFVLAACARYYMLLALLVLAVMVPRDRKPRYGLVLAVLVGVSIVGPFAKQLIPEYSSEDLLEGAPPSGLFFAAVIDNFGYAVIYPLKYLMLIPTRAYGVLVGASEDYMGGFVSLLSAVMLAAIVLKLLRWKTLDRTVQRLIVAGFVAPIPIMWSEIMHWRYYSFVYFFFLYALVLHRQQRTGRQRTHAVDERRSGPALGSQAPDH